MCGPVIINYLSEIMLSCIVTNVFSVTYTKDIGKENFTSASILMYVQVLYM